MQRNLKLRNYKITKLHNSQRGYMLITLMLAMALMSLALLVVLPDMKQQILRDREDEMRHRGTAYMRAIQHFYKKFGRYPSRLEDLENTNNLRFLRRRYTDPLTRDQATGKEKDFKLLHQQDISLNSGLVLPGATPGATPGALPGQTPGQTGVGGAAQLLQSAIATQAAGVQPTLTQNAAGDASDATTDNPNSSGSPTNSPSGLSSGSSSASGFNGPTFGGGPILGVVSTSKAKSIRIFNDKNHYNDWLFVYIPQADRGGLLVGPVSTNGPTAGFGGPVAPNQPGQGMNTSGNPSSSMQPGSSIQPTQNVGQPPQQ